MLNRNDYEKLNQLTQSNYYDVVKKFIDERILMLKDKVSNTPIRTNEDIYVSCELKGEIRALKNLLPSIEENIKDFNHNERKE